jgi:hypothetical protein
MRPSGAWIPFYICDAALIPFRAAGVPVEFYAIDEAFDPILPPGVPEPGECLLYVNFFGLKTSTAASLVSAHPGQVIVDDTQAFFVRGYDHGWSFNSARKFFGVADGAYVYGPGVTAGEWPRVPQVHYDHLVNRLLGAQDLAYEQYLQSEACVPADLWRMSILSERLLSNIDYELVREQRRGNFAFLREAIGHRDGLTPAMVPDASEVPYCFPFLAPEPVPWRAFWSRKAFLPRLWPEIPGRAGSAQFAWERGLSERLLPLPIDHRYGRDDLERLIEIVGEVLRW